MLPEKFYPKKIEEDQTKPAIQLTPECSRTCPTKEPKDKMGRILLMDDEDLIRNIAVSMLERMGYETEVSQEGSEAIEAYEQAMNSENPFDAVILDLDVKSGMGGLETIKALKAMDAKVRAIISSGFSNDPVMDRFKEYGFQGALPKPYRMKEVEDELHKVVMGTEK